MDNYQNRCLFRLLAAFSDMAYGLFSRKGSFFSRKYLESVSTLSNKTHLLQKTLKPSRYGVNTKAIKQCRTYGNGVREVT